MRGQKGVTLIEVMVVVAIVGILAAIAIPAYDDYITRSRRSDAFTALETVRAAQEMYRAEKGFYASSFAGNVLAGCASNMAGDNYTIENLNRGNPPVTYTVEATPKNKQTGDYSFRINQDGGEWYYDVKASSPSWKNDKKFEDLR
jgi:type IV pilus assembly protein PilE